MELHCIFIKQQTIQINTSIPNAISNFKMFFFKFIFLLSLQALS